MHIIICGLLPLDWRQRCDANLEKEFVNSGFQVKPPEELNDYLSCNININKEKRSAIFIKAD